MYVSLSNNFTIITLTYRVLMPNLEQRPRVGQIEMGGSLRVGASGLKRAGVGAGLAQPAQAFNEHWRRKKGIIPIDQII